MGDHTERRESFHRDVPARLMIRVIDDVLTADQCSSLIALIERAGDVLRHQHLPAKVDYITVVSPETHRLVVAHGDDISAIMRTAPDGVRPQWGNVERRRDPAGMPFHFDNADPYTAVASVTYLNDDYEGGETIIRPAGEGSSRFDTVIRPRIGRTVFFNGVRSFHAVSPIVGTRYTLPLWCARMPADYPQKLRWWL